MVGYEEHREELASLDASIVAGSVDTLEKAQVAAADVNFPVAHGVTRDMADAMGAWWEDRRQILQATEFILDREGKVLTSMYCSGPAGRIAAENAVRQIAFWRSR